MKTVETKNNMSGCQVLDEADALAKKLEREARDTNVRILACIRILLASSEYLGSDLLGFLEDEQKHFEDAVSELGESTEDSEQQDSQVVIDEQRESDELPESDGSGMIRLVLPQFEELLDRFTVAGQKKILSVLQDRMPEKALAELDEEARDKARDELINCLLPLSYDGQTKVYKNFLELLKDTSWLQKSA